MKNEFLSGTNQVFNEEVFNDSTHAWSVCFMIIPSILNETLSAKLEYVLYKPIHYTIYDNE